LKAAPQNFDKPLLGVWRPEYYEAPADVADLAGTAAPGTLISTSYTVTLQEPSKIRINAKAYGLSDDDSTWYTWVLMLYEGATGITLRDQMAASTYHAGAVHIFGNASCLYEATYAAGAYVFEVRAYVTTTNKVALAYIKWSIDVCRT
jgi:hypothetical protein